MIFLKKNSYSWKEGGSQGGKVKCPSVSFFSFPRRKELKGFLWEKERKRENDRLPTHHYKRLFLLLLLPFSKTRNCLIQIQMPIFLSFSCIVGLLGKYMETRVPAKKYNCAKKSQIMILCSLSFDDFLRCCTEERDYSPYIPHTS